MSSFRYVDLETDKGRGQKLTGWQNLKSRHTQYLLFKFAMKSHRLMDLFIGTLFNLA
jgi:hypothetical protein